MVANFDQHLGTITYTSKLTSPQYFFLLQIYSKIHIYHIYFGFTLKFKTE